MFVSLAIVEQVERRLGVGTLVSVGNEAGIEIADVIAHYARDPVIKVIASYMEGARDGRKLSHALAMARAAGKRVVILKVGRSEESARAARSHTGSLTGDYRVYQSIFAANGVIEAEGPRRVLRPDRGRCPYAGRRSGQRRPPADRRLRQLGRPWRAGRGQGQGIRPCPGRLHRGDAVGAARALARRSSIP